MTAREPSREHGGESDRCIVSIRTLGPGFLGGLLIIISHPRLLPGGNEFIGGLLIIDHPHLLPGGHELVIGVLIEVVGRGDDTGLLVIAADSRTVEVEAKVDERSQDVLRTGGLPLADVLRDVLDKSVDECLRGLEGRSLDVADDHVFESVVPHVLDVHVIDLAGQSLCLVDERLRVVVLEQSLDGGQSLRSTEIEPLGVEDDAVAGNGDACHGIKFLISCGRGCRGRSRPVRGIGTLAPSRPYRRPPGLGGRMR